MTTKIDWSSVFKKKHSREGDICALCNREIPSGKLCIKQEDTKKIICLFCMIGLAEVV